MLLEVVSHVHSLKQRSLFKHLACLNSCPVPNLNFINQVIAQNMVFEIPPQNYNTLTKRAEHLWFLQEAILSEDQEGAIM